MLVIGLGHKARQGKNTVAEMLVKEFAAIDVYAKQYAFADALKAYCRVAFGMRSKNSELLQTVGTNLFRIHVCNNIWIETLFQQIKEEQPQVAIITDVRFLNEAAALRHIHSEMGDYLGEYASYHVNVKRLDPITGDQYIATDRNPNHASEVELDDYTGYNYYLVNSGTIQDLRRQVNELVRLELKHFIL